MVGATAIGAQTEHDGVPDGGAGGVPGVVALAVAGEAGRGGGQPADVRAGLAPHPGGEVNLVAAELTQYASVPVNQVNTWLSRINQAGYGRPTLVGNPAMAAAVRVRTDDRSSAVLVVYSASDTSNALPAAHGQQLATLAKTLAAQTIR